MRNLKKKRIIKLILFLIMMLCILSKNYFVLAQEKIDVISNKEVIKKEEEFEISVSINDNTIASLTLQIYFDMTKLEYINKTKNANFAQNRVIYTWVDENAGTTARTSNEIEKFVFKGLQEGIANIVVTGEFYDNNGSKIEMEDGSMQIQIEEINEQQENGQNTEEAEEQVSSDNTNLKIMRINEEGISPEFQKNIKEYYFIANNNTSRLEVTAIPENSKATVTITGNTNLKQGLNIINIQVQSEDKTQISDYKIYVTKTNNKELANSNLENLAIREAMLYPSFDANITQYDIEVANHIDKVDVLAIPERINATVKINGNDDLKIGANTITINVTAEDGITSKKYIINAHRRNEQEEIEAKEEEKNQTEQLTAILENTQEDNNNEQNEEKSSKIKKVDMITFALIGIIAIGFMIGIIINHKKK